MKLTRAAAADAETTDGALCLTDEELQTVLDAVVFYRDAHMEARATLGLPLVVLDEGEVLDVRQILGGTRIRCANGLITTFYQELSRRHPFLGELVEKRTFPGDTAQGMEEGDTDDYYPGPAGEPGAPTA